MDVFLSTMARASGGMEAQSARLRAAAENIANADTPGYRRKLVPFERVLLEDGGATVRAGRTILDRGELPEVYDPGHPMADAEGYYEGSNVALMIEIGDAREAQRSYEANMRVLDQARQMAGSLLQLLRR
ncbi:MAG: flagellar basal body rod protein FlgC [Pseudomonadota bacterium]